MVVWLVFFFLLQFGSGSKEFFLPNIGWTNRMNCAFETGMEMGKEWKYFIGFLTIADEWMCWLADELMGNGRYCNFKLITLDVINYIQFTNGDQYSKNAATSLSLVDYWERIKNELIFDLDICELFESLSLDILLVFKLITCAEKFELMDALVDDRLSTRSHVSWPFVRKLSCDQAIWKHFRWTMLLFRITNKIFT